MSSKRDKQRRKALREQLGLSNKEFKALSKEYKVFEVPKKIITPIVEDNGKGGFKIVGWNDAVGSANVTECVSAQRKLYQEIKKMEKDPNYTSRLRPLPSDSDLDSIQQQVVADATKEKKDGKPNSESRKDSMGTTTESGLQSEND